jgi:hypothetical protein
MPFLPICRSIRLEPVYSPNVKQYLHKNKFKLWWDQFGSEIQAQDAGVVNQCFDDT